MSLMATFEEKCPWIRILHILEDKLHQIVKLAKDKYSEKISVLGFNNTHRPLNTPHKNEIKDMRQKTCDSL